MLTAYEIPGLSYSLPATTAIKRYRFVSIDSNGLAIQATASTPILGVSRNEIDPVGNPNDQILDVADGIMIVEAGGIIAAGNTVSSDASGKAVVATDAEQSTSSPYAYTAGSPIAGVALTNATGAGVLVAIKCFGVSAAGGADGADGADGASLQTISYTGTGDALVAQVIGAAAQTGVISKVYIISLGTASGIDDSNTSVFALKVGSTTKATETFDATTAFPANGSLIELTVASEAVSAGDVLTLTVTNGSTADVPAYLVQVVVATA